MYNFKVTQNGFYGVAPDKECADKCVEYLNKQQDLVASASKERHRVRQAFEGKDCYGLEANGEDTYVYIIHWSLLDVAWTPELDQDLTALAEKLKVCFNIYNIDGRTLLEHDDCVFIGSYEKNSGKFRFSDVTWVHALGVEQVDELRTYAFNKGYVGDKDI